MNTHPRPARPAPIDWNARARRPYLCPEAAAARVASRPTPRGRLNLARHLLATARNPRNIFGLTVADIPAAVVCKLEAIIASLSHVDDAVRALALRHSKLEKQGYAQDTLWNIIEDEATPLGFYYGDSTYLREVARA